MKGPPLLFLVGREKRAQGITIDIHHVGKTTWSHARLHRFAASRTTTANVAVEKRGVFVERIIARLQLQRGFTDADLDDAVRVASTGLIKSAA
jgi:hypothetical protein